MKKILFISLLIISFCSNAQTWQYYDSLSTIYKERRSYDTAMVFAEKAMSLIKERFGENDTLFANALTVIMEVYYNSGKYAKAIEYCEKEKEIRKSVQGIRHPSYASTINNLAYLYWTIGNYNAAEPLFIEAKNIKKEVLGEKNISYATALNNLAYLYNDMGNYPAAEPLFLEAMNIFKELSGITNKDYGIALNNLAILYKTMGNYQAAEPLYLETKNIRKEIYGEKHPLYAKSLNNLASLYQETCNYSLAESLYLEARDILKVALGDKHVDFAAAICNLANMYTSIGNYSAAEPLYLEARNIRRDVLGEKHPLYAKTLLDIAQMYFLMNNYSSAEPLLIESKNIFLEVLGRQHPDYIQSLNDLALLYSITGKLDAEPLYIECIDLINNTISKNFAFLSEKEKEMYFKTQSDKFAGFYSFSLRRKNYNPEITVTVFNSVVRNKGLLLKSSTSMRTFILGCNDSALIDKYNQWIGLLKEIDKLNQTDVGKRKKDPKELEGRANNLEKELVRGSQVFSDFEKLQNLTWKDLQTGLKPGEAAIEFIHFKNSGSNSGSSSGSSSRDTVLYCALIVKPDSKYPEMIKLCEEKELVTLLSSAGKKVNLLYDKNSTIAGDLYKLIWYPMENELKDIKTVYLSPSGWLHKISFPALVKDKNTFLCDVFDIREQTSTAKIAIPESFSFDNNTSATIFGGIRYNTNFSKDETWQYLEGTKKEACEISKLLSKKLKKVSVFTDSLGTESCFKEVAQNSNWLHVSTHGFFYPDPESTPITYQKQKTETGTVTFRGGAGYGLWQFVRNKNPLMRSGLVFAGANEVWNEEVITDREDGMLTAQEVAVLDMRKCNLVVLSACETGLGDIKGSEGVYGLQRAFKMAGVKYIIMSLWQVPDKETVEFMEMFYKKLLKEKDVRQAFNETQKEMRKKYDPYFWAAFVLIE